MSLINKVSDLGSNSLADEKIKFRRMTYNSATRTHNPSKTSKELFIQGPIPLGWMHKAAALGGKALAVGISLWFLKGVKKSNTFRVTKESQTIASCTRQTYNSALSTLESAGLIKLYSSVGRRPLVNILTLDQKPDETANNI